jgi:exopolysaccharide production protein ExoY
VSTVPTETIQQREDFFPGTVSVQESSSFTSAEIEGVLSPAESWRYLHLKRWVDVAGAFILILACLIPGLLIMATIFLTSRGPIFYREERVGREGRLFRIWKFRSMRKDAHRLRYVSTSGPSKKMEWRMRKGLKDPRITPIGGFLRRWSLDEVPQLLNVLRGEMSLVGPRPIVRQEMSFYGNLISHYLAVTPGMSGLWQVSGRNDIDYDSRARMDAFYVETWSLKSDFEILVRTIPAVLSRTGAC